jgi:hypothetical protein
MKNDKKNNQINSLSERRFLKRSNDINILNNNLNNDLMYNNLPHDNNKIRLMNNYINNIVNRIVTFYILIYLLLCLENNYK